MISARAYAVAAGIALIVAFTDKSPVVDHSIVGIDISGVVAKTGLAIGTGTYAAIGGGLTAIGLIGIFVVVGIVVVPHVADQISAVVMEYSTYGLVFYFFLHQAFAIVLVQCVHLYLVFGKFNVLDQEAHGARIRAGEYGT